MNKHIKSCIFLHVKKFLKQKSVDRNVCMNEPEIEITANGKLDH